MSYLSPLDAIEMKILSVRDQITRLEEDERILRHARALIAEDMRIMDAEAKVPIMVPVEPTPAVAPEPAEPAKASHKANFKCKRWTHEEDAIIRRFYPGRGPAAVMRELPHRSASAIAQRACHLGVKIHKDLHLAAPPPPPSAAADAAPVQQPTNGKRAESFEEKLGRVERGEVGIAPVIKITTPAPDMTLGGVPSGQLG